MSDYNLGTASGKIEIDGRAAAVGFKVAESAAGAFFDVVKYKVESVQNLGKKMAAVGTAGTIGFGAAIKVAANFESQMSGVNAVVNGTGDEMDALRDKALQLGADTTFSASQAASAIEELAKAGIPVADILNGAADGAVALAAAGGIGLEEAATISANAMNQFTDIASKDLPEVANILAGVANTSAADVSSIGQSLSQAGAVANLAGLTFKDTAIAIGEMADAGINGSDAGTSLKTMLNNLIPTTEKQSSMFKDLNLLTYNLADANKTLDKQGLKQVKTMDQARGSLAKYVAELGKGKVGSVKNAKAVDQLLMKQGGLNNAFFDAKGNVKDLAGLQGTLAKSLKGMTKEQKLSSLETLFGADAMRATAILSLAGRKGYEDFAKAVGETSAADVAAARLDNLDGAMEQFKGSMETAMITVGSIFLPGITKIIQFATFLVNAFNNLPGPIKIVIGVLAAIASAGLLVVGMILALLPLILSMVANFLLMRGISAATSAVRGFYGAVKAGQGIMAASAAANSAFSTSVKNTATRTAFATKIMYGLTRATYLLGVALKAALLNPYTIALLALVAVGILLYKNFKPFRDLVDNLAALLKDKLGQAWTALQPAIQAGVAALKEFGAFVKSNLLPVIQTIAKELLGKLMMAWKEISKALQAQLMPALRELGALFTGTVLPALQKAGAFIGPLIVFVLKLYAALYGLLFKAWMKIAEVMISFVFPILLKIAGFFAGQLIGAIVLAVKGIIQAVTGIVQIFSGLIDFFAGLFTGDWGRMWDGIVSIFKGIWNLIIGLIKVYFAVGILKTVGLGFKLLGGIVKLGWRLILALFKSSGKLILNSVKLPFQLIAFLIKSYIKIWVFIVKNGFSLMVRLIRASLNLAKNVVMGIFNTIRAFLGGGVAAARGVVVNGFTAMKNGVVKAFHGLKDGVVVAFRAVMKFVRSIPGKIIGVVDDLATKMYNSGKEMISQLAEGIKKGFDLAVSAMKKGAGLLGKLVPGSPVKEGPLKKFNRGGVGMRLMEFMADGINDGSSQVLNAASRVAAAMHSTLSDQTFSASMDAKSMVTPMQSSVVAPIKTKPGAKASAKSSRVVSGYLEMRNGRAYIQGIAEDVVNADKSFKATTGRRDRNN